jgi:RNA polymerase sigma factor (sigma-70 family)
MKMSMELTAREKMVLEMRFGDKGVSLAKVAEVLGVSRERVRQIENLALAKLSMKEDVVG